MRRIIKECRRKLHGGSFPPLPQRSLKEEATRSFLPAATQGEQRQDGCLACGGHTSSPSQPHGRTQSLPKVATSPAAPSLPAAGPQEGRPVLGLCFWHTAVWANWAPSHTTSYFLANCCPHKHPQPRACMTLDVHHDFFLWTKARQRAAPRRAGAVQHPCSAPLGDMHSPGLPPEPPCSRLPPEPGAPSQASWRPGTARHRPCCHGEDFCATSHTKEIAPSLGCSANEEEEEKSGGKGWLASFLSLFISCRRKRY